MLVCFPPLDSPIRYSEALGAGALLDAGTYTLHAARQFYGREPIDSHATLDNDDQEVDIQGSVLGILVRVKQHNWPLALQINTKTPIAYGVRRES